MKVHFNDWNRYEANSPIQLQVEFTERELNYIRLYEHGDLNASLKNVIQLYIEVNLDVLGDQ